MFPRLILFSSNISFQVYDIFYSFEINMGSILLEHSVKWKSIEISLFRVHYVLNTHLKYIIQVKIWYL